MKKFREQLGMTQEDFGLALGRTRVSYMLLEAGRVAPSTDWVIDMVHYLKKKGISVSLDYLFDQTENQNLVGSYKELQEKYQLAQKELARAEEINGLQKELLKKKWKK